MTEESNNPIEPETTEPVVPSLREYTEHELFIQIRDGQPHEHPIFGDNFRAAFPDVDPENLPADRFARFIRVQAPIVGTFEVAEVSYGWVDGVVKDIWTIRPMTEEEEAAKRDQMVAEAYALRDALAQQAQDMLVQVTEPIGNQAWRETLAALLTWQLESVDPIMPALPRFPFRSPKGEWRKPNKQ
jgi:hypothetical protein